VLVVPGTDEQQVAHDDPAGGGRPARLEDHGARQVATGRRNHDVRGPQAEPAGVAIEDRAEHARRVHARQAEPLHVAAWRYESGGFAVGQERVLTDAREGRVSAHPGMRRASRRLVPVVLRAPSAHWAGKSCTRRKPMPATGWWLALVAVIRERGSLPASDGGGYSPEIQSATRSRAAHGRWGAPTSAWKEAPRTNSPLPASARALTSTAHRRQIGVGIREIPT